MAKAWLVALCVGSPHEAACQKAAEAGLRQTGVWAEVVRAERHAVLVAEKHAGHDALYAASVAAGIAGGRLHIRGGPLSDEMDLDWGNGVGVRLKWRLR
ncbi:MAG: hypothetical protein IT285_16180 [Bdellovibrionales bacterium]|nr:hypothetical protein [Bdellovibrionales bacterium]